MSFIEVLCRIVTEAAIPGVISILSFVPTIALLIFILTLLKESGLVRGNSALYLMGFSCSVPAILACRDISDKRLRYLTMLTIPYMSCSAKLPIYVMLAAVFFPAFPVAAVGSIYLAGILMVVLARLLAKGTKFQCLQNTHRFAPGFRQSLRRPSLKPIFDAVKDSCLGFVKKAFTVILASSIIIWLLQNLDTSLHFTHDIEESLLAHIGILLEPIFEPLGFGDRRAIAALLAGIISKESIVGTFAVLAGSPEGQALSMMLRDIFTPASAFSFMMFCLLYTPCIGTLIAMRNAAGNLRIPIVAFCGQTALAWCLSFLIFYSIKVII